ncbi:MAG: outer membrane protein assembly factor [Pseudomonadales bacterium]|nr:outer membrane protein assembly factor [Halioglobus sp.]MCP5123161.1 outer membrane protein assembly factor [Pseudomonadales bacterium]MCP5192806.1 outer membrane protein assembly factor [Pseudomonadales bacterium]
MRYFCGFLLLLWLVVPSALAAADKPLLQYELVGLKGALLDNARAWLGDAPETPQDRANFLATAEERVESSLKALGYYNPDIETVIKRTEPVWSLQITVTPGDPVLIGQVSVELRGAAADDKAFQELFREAPFAEGNVFNHGDYERFKTRVLTLGQERGYFDARFSQSQVKVNVVSDQADIFLHYDSGQRFRFGAIDYSHTDLEPGLLTALQPIHAGDYFDQSRLQYFQAQLQRTGYFAGVVIKPLFDQVTDYRVPLSVTLHPAQSHGFDVGLGYSTDTQERVSMVWRTPRVNRYGHSQQTRISYSVVNPRVQFTYTIPLSHPLDDVVHLSVLLEHNKFGDVDSEQWELGALREIRRGKWLYSYSGRELSESWELKNTHYNSSYLLPGFTLSRSDRGGSLVDPSSGFSQFYQLEGASADLGSDIDLLRLTANFSYVVTPAPRHRVVARTALGAVFIADDDRINLAPSLRFFAGGSQSLRAFGYQSIGGEIEVTRDNGSQQTLVVGGDRLVTGTLEYQYYFTDTWRGAVFVDAGDAFDSTDFNLKVGPGFGVHYMSPVGAVRVEVANSVSEDDPEWRLVLNIGAEF